MKEPMNKKLQKKEMKFPKWRRVKLKTKITSRSNNIP